MIEFKKLTYKNFLSVGNRPLEIDLSGNGICLITGANGNGKSAVILALYYALYGKSFRKINLSGMINNINKKQLLVTLEFSVNGSEYRIVRGMKPNVFEIWVNGHLKEQNASAKEYQDWLTYRVLKMDERTFRQLVVVGSTLFVPFMRLSAADRRVVIDDLLSLDVFSGMLGVAKQRLSALEQEQHELESRSSLLRVELRAEKEKSRSIENLIQDSIRKIQEENEEILKSRIPSLLTEANRLDQEIKNTDQGVFVSEHEKTEQGIRESERKQVHLEKDVSFAKKVVGFFQKNSSCPSCGQTISEELADEKITFLNGKISDFQRELDELTREQEKRRQDLLRLEEEIRGIRKKHTDYASAMKSLRHYKELIDSNNRKIQNFRDQENNVSVQNEEKIISISDDIAALEKDISKLKEKRKHYDTILLMLRDEGIKSVIVKSYLPFINSIIKKYIGLTEFNISFSFNENFEETIKTRNREIMEYNNLSEGEQQRINFALLFAFRELTRLKSSISTNLLIIDEVGDSLLDYDGIMAINNIFRSIDSRIMIITHYPEHYREIAKSKIEFQKSGHFTSVREESLS